MMFPLDDSSDPRWASYDNRTREDSLRESIRAQRRYDDETAPRIEYYFLPSPDEVPPFFGYADDPFPVNPEED